MSARTRCVGGLAGRRGRARVAGQWQLHRRISVSSDHRRNNRCLAILPVPSSPAYGRPSPAFHGRIKRDDALADATCLACGGPGLRRGAARPRAGGAEAALLGGVLGKGHPRPDDAEVRRRPAGGAGARALLRRQPLQAGDRARGAAARQPRDGQHRAAGRRQPGAGILHPDRGLRLPRRRPHARLLRQRLRPGDGRPRRGAARHQDPRPDLLRHPPGRAEAGDRDQDPRRPGRDQAAHARRRRLAVPRPGARRQPDADGLCRGLYRAADRRHRRPGQPAAERREHEVLRGDEPDRPDLATSSATTC